MTLQDENEDFIDRAHAKPAYTLLQIITIIVLAGVLTVCCLTGMALGIWAMVGDHISFLQRVGLGLSSLFLIGAAVVALIVRGLAGFRLTLACFYFLPIPIISVFAAGGISVGVLSAAILLFAIVALHQPMLIRFYKTRRPVVFDHLLALCPVVFLLCPSML